MQNVVLLSCVLLCAQMSFGMEQAINNDGFTEIGSHSTCGHWEYLCTLSNRNFLIKSIFSVDEEEEKNALATLMQEIPVTNGETIVLNLCPYQECMGQLYQGNKGFSINLALAEDRRSTAQVNFLPAQAYTLKSRFSRDDGEHAKSFRTLLRANDKNEIDLTSFEDFVAERARNSIKIELYYTDASGKSVKYPIFPKFGNCEGVGYTTNSTLGVNTSYAMAIKKLFESKGLMLDIKDLEQHIMSQSKKTFLERWAPAFFGSTVIMGAWIFFKWWRGR